MMQYTFKALFPTKRPNQGIVHLPVNIGPIESFTWGENPQVLQRWSKEQGLTVSKPLAANTVIELQTHGHNDECRTTTPIFHEATKHMLYDLAEDRLVEWWIQSNRWEDEHDFINRMINHATSFNQILFTSKIAILRAAMITNSGLYADDKHENEHAEALIRLIADVKSATLKARPNQHEWTHCRGCGETNQHSAITADGFCPLCDTHMKTEGSYQAVCAGIW